jgi:hypothetical protein
MDMADLLRIVAFVRLTIEPSCLFFAKEAEGVTFASINAA